MKRPILAFFAGLFTWVSIATLINRGLRFGLPGYAAVEQSMQFTLPMRLSRLAMAAVASLAAGVVVKLVAPENRYIVWILGGVFLAAFIPQHVRLWAVFPLWYHLTFLVTLAPLMALGTFLARRRPVPEPNSPSAAGQSP